MVDLFPGQKLPRGLESHSRHVLGFRVSSLVLPDGLGSAWASNVSLGTLGTTDFFPSLLQRNPEQLEMLGGGGGGGGEVS